MISYDSHIKTRIERLISIVKHPLPSAPASASALGSTHFRIPPPGKHIRYLRLKVMSRFDGRMGSPYTILKSIHEGIKGNCYEIIGNVEGKYIMCKICMHDSVIRFEGPFEKIVSMTVPVRVMWSNLQQGP